MSISNIIQGLIDMQLFHIIEEGIVIIRGKGGVYRQSKVYRRGEKVYAYHAGGFIELMGMRATSSPHVSWLDIEADGVTIDKPGTYGGGPKWEGKKK